MTHTSESPKTETRWRLNQIRLSSIQTVAEILKVTHFAACNVVFAIHKVFLISFYSVRVLKYWNRYIFKRCIRARRAEQYKALEAVRVAPAKNSKLLSPLRAGIIIHKLHKNTKELMACHRHKVRHSGLAICCCCCCCCCRRVMIWKLLISFFFVVFFLHNDNLRVMQAGAQGHLLLGNISIKH